MALFTDAATLCHSLLCYSILPANISVTAWFTLVSAHVLANNHSLSFHPSFCLRSISPCLSLCMRSFWPLRSLSLSSPRGPTSAMWEPWMSVTLAVSCHLVTEQIPYTASTAIGQCSVWMWLSEGLLSHWLLITEQNPYCAATVRYNNKENVWKVLKRLLLGNCVKPIEFNKLLWQWIKWSWIVLLGINAMGITLFKVHVTESDWTFSQGQEKAPLCTGLHHQGMWNKLST